MYFVTLVIWVTNKDINTTSHHWYWHLYQYWYWYWSIMLIKLSIILLIIPYQNLSVRPSNNSSHEYHSASDDHSSWVSIAEYICCLKMQYCPLLHSALHHEYSSLFIQLSGSQLMIKHAWFLNGTKLNTCWNSWNNSVRSPHNNRTFGIQLLRI